MKIALGNFGRASFLSKIRVNSEVLASILPVSPYISVEIVRRVTNGLISNMWSAGAMLFQMLSNELPFTSHSDKKGVQPIMCGILGINAEAWDAVSAKAKALCGKSCK